MNQTGYLRFIRFRQGLFHGVDPHFVAPFPGKLEYFLAELEAVPQRVIASDAFFHYFAGHHACSTRTAAAGTGDYDLGSAENLFYIFMPEDLLLLYFGVSQDGQPGGIDPVNRVPGLVVPGYPVLHFPVGIFIFPGFSPFAVFFRRSVFFTGRYTGEVEMKASFKMVLGLTFS